MATVVHRVMGFVQAGARSGGAFTSVTGFALHGLPSTARVGRVVAFVLHGEEAASDTADARLVEAPFQAIEPSGVDIAPAPRVAEALALEAPFAPMAVVGLTAPTVPQAPPAERDWWEGGAWMARFFDDEMDDTEVSILDGGRPSPLGKDAEKFLVGTQLRATYNALHSGGWGSIADELEAGAGGSTFGTYAGRVYPVNTTLGVATVTPPLNPRRGDAFAVVDARNTFNSNNCVIAVTGLLVNGSVAVADITLATDGEYAEFVWMSDLIGWKRIRS